MRLLVVDASAIVDLIARFDAARLDDLLLSESAVLAAPSLLDIEVMQVFRRLDRGGSFRTPSVKYLDTYKALRIHRYGHVPLLPRIWELRANLTAYDAAYVALAEALRAPLVTRDRRVARAPSIEVEMIVP